ncbi:hypothetical protein CI105_02310 [Candidatus Izimaplasma bacterium ZiA1]|uniref:hypothetical protein n=1 Tax=Candidatus Izimoplasma sp. ZiA1 TaxID=2024899 RepID=UPI000BAA88B0|nr:hypothetical protein CI105_02310 [Candidatus Izimaplasma bacterium ZiA1]
MSKSEMWMSVVGGILMLLGIFKVGTSTRRNRWIVNLLGETGYQIFLIVIGATFLILALFTNVFYE